MQQVINFLQETQTFLDETSWVERYSWFGAMENMQGVNEVRKSILFIFLENHLFI